MNSLFNDITSSIKSSLNMNFDPAQFTSRQQNRRSEIANNSNSNNINNITNNNSNIENINQSNNNIIHGLSFSETLENFMAHNDLPQDIAIAIASASARYELDPNLIRAVIRTESDYNPNAVSRAGAMGLMQLMPATAESLGVTDPFNISQNVHAGTRYLRQLLDRFEGDLELALAAYNAGAGNVIRHGGVPPFRETQNYIPRVMERKENYIAAQYAAISGINTSNNI